MEMEQMEVLQEGDAFQQQQEEQEESGPIRIERLQDHGVNIKDIEKLQQAGLFTVEAVLYSTLKTLTQVKGITDAKANKLLEVANKLIPTGFTTATEFLKRRDEVIYITTGSKEVFAHVVCSNLT